jgi:hypothetical protein
MLQFMMLLLEKVVSILIMWVWVYGCSKVFMLNADLFEKLVNSLIVSEIIAYIRF